MLLLVVMFLVLTGCAINMQGIRDNIQSRVDPISIKDHSKFLADIDECATYAAAEYQRARSELMTKSIIGAIAGAGIGYGLGSMYGQRTANHGAAYGALGGAAGGASASKNHLDTVVANCMIHRGYSLLW